MNPAYGSWEPGTRMRPAGAHRSGLYAFRPGTEHRSRTYLDEEPIGSLGFPMLPAITACIEVWRGVVENAIRAALGGQPSSKSRGYELRRTKEILTAREWIWSKEFDVICELAFFHPEPFRRALVNLPEVMEPEPLPPKEPKERKRRGPKPWVLMTPQEQARAEDAYERKRRKEIKAAERESREQKKRQAQHQREVLELYGRMEEVRRLEARQSERAEAWRKKYLQHMAQFQHQAGGNTREQPT